VTYSDVIEEKFENSSYYITKSGDVLFEEDDILLIDVEGVIFNHRDNVKCQQDVVAG